MIVKLCKKSIVIEDVNQHECVELENYRVHFGGVINGIYILDILKDKTEIITIRTNNLILIDKR